LTKNEKGCIVILAVKETDENNAASNTDWEGVALIVGIFATVFFFLGEPDLQDAIIAYLMK